MDAAGYQAVSARTVPRVEMITWRTGNDGLAASQACLTICSMEWQQGTAMMRMVRDLSYRVRKISVKRST